MNLLLTSAGRRSYLIDFFKQALNGKGKIHAGNSNFTSALLRADYSVITPLIYDKTYIDFLIEYCNRNEINAVISLFDIDLPILSKSRDRFDEIGVRLVVSDYTVTMICNDKWLTFNWLKENNFTAPLTYKNIEAARKALEEKELNYPLIIKPRWGMGSIGIYQADNQSEMEILYNKTREKILGSYLKSESEIDMDNCILIQEKLIGSEYGLDVLNDLNGNYLTCVPKKKIAMRAGETDSAEVLDDKELIKLGIELSKSLKHIADLDVDIIKAGNYLYILELNCRFGGQYPFAHIAGVDFPKVIVQILSGEEINRNLLKFKSGTIGMKDLVIVKRPDVISNIFKDE